MGNSTLVALALFALFLVYITARGRLPQYLAVFFGTVTSDQGGSSVASTATPGGILGSIGSIGSQLATGGLSGAVPSPAGGNYGTSGTGGL